MTPRVWGRLHLFPIDVEGRWMTPACGEETAQTGKDARDNGSPPVCQGRGKVVTRALGLGGCHREGATARRSAPSSRRPTNRRVALTWAGGVHSTCSSEPQSILQRQGEGAGRDHRRSEPQS